MFPRLARLVVAVVTICAFLGAGLVQNMPSAQADTAAGMAMMADQGGDGAPMPCHDGQAPPCKDKVPGCMTDLGCLFVVGIPRSSRARRRGAGLVPGGLLAVQPLR